jgi:Mrp family chromosome partitioning ATPase
MSKNFELLQQVRNDEELFQTAAQSRDAVAAVGAGPSPELDNETVERTLQKASLPDVFQIMGEPERQPLTVRSEPSPDLNVENASGNLQSKTLADRFRTSTNLAGPIGPAALQPIGEAGKHAENRAMRVAASNVSLPKTLHADRKPKATPGTVSQKLVPDAKKKVQQRISQKLSLSISWVDSIRSGAKGWARNVRERNKHYGEDLEAITRGEEIKLVQRVFPGTDEGSPRTVLFARLDGEAGCAPTCARVAEILAARAEGPVCVVDANFRAPSLHEYFGVENVNGLAEATVESGPIQNFAQQIPEPDLWLMPTGKAAAQLRFPMMADGLRVRMEELRNTFRYVVIHASPLRLETSAMLLSRWTDGVVLVLEANATRRDTARRVKEILDAANVSVLGVVLNNRTFPIPDAIYRRL